MRSLAQSRLLLVTLAVVLQLALLPQGARLGCAVTAAEASCCCGPAPELGLDLGVASPGGAGGCCGMASEGYADSDADRLAGNAPQPDDRQPVDGDPHGPDLWLAPSHGACACDLDGEVPPVAWALTAPHTEDDGEHEDAVALAPPPWACGPRLGHDPARVARPQPPPAHSGSALHVLHQVFLI